MSRVKLVNIEDLPRGSPLETPLTQNKAKRKYSPLTGSLEPVPCLIEFVSVEEETNGNETVLARDRSGASTPRKVKECASSESSRDAEDNQFVNYGSESEDDDGEEDCNDPIGMSLGISKRAFLYLDTPEDQDTFPKPATSALTSTAEVSLSSSSTSVDVGAKRALLYFTLEEETPSLELITSPIVSTPKRSKEDMSPSSSTSVDVGARRALSYFKLEEETPSLETTTSPLDSTAKRPKEDLSSSIKTVDVKAKKTYTYWDRLEDRPQPLVLTPKRQKFHSSRSPKSAQRTNNAKSQQKTAKQPWMSDSLFKFDWTDFPAKPIPPKKRRENFSETNCGPTIECIDPYKIFCNIWDQRFMKRIVTETNRYAQQLTEKMIAEGDLKPVSRICHWTDTSVGELYVFFAMVLSMGIVVKSRLAEYWMTDKSIFITPGFSAHMPLKRFQLIEKCLHFNDNNSINTQKLNASEAKLFKIEPIITHLNEKFQALYKLDQNLALDESLLQWRGLLSINQIIPNKAAQVGIKSYELCESQSGYLWRFTIHAYASSPAGTNQNPLSTTTSTLVLKLIQGLEHKGHTLWMDNYYNSPVLARKLKQLGFDCVGTLRTNRLFVPQELKDLKKADMVKSQVAGFTSGDVDVMVWRDSNRVATISTYHGNAVSTDAKGITKPILIRDYNVMMGEVDKKNQLLAMYPLERKRTAVWYKKLFRRLLNISVLNSYIIHKRQRNNPRPMTHRNFRIELIQALLRHGTCLPFVIEPDQTFFDAKTHYPSEFPFLPKGTARRRQVCVICSKRTTIFCAGCEKAACIPCFSMLHF